MANQNQPAGGASQGPEQPKRKSNRQFDLNKSPKHSFNLQKEADEPQGSAAPPQPKTPAPAAIEAEQQQFEAAEQHQQQLRSSNNTLKGVMAVAVIVLAVLIIWWLWPSGCGTAEIEEVPVVEQPTAAPDDSVPSEEEIVVDEPTAETPVVEEAAPETAPSPQPAPQAAPAPAPKPVAPAVSGDIEAEAQNVIRGQYGNNPDRRAALGDRYQPIQDRVNQLMKARQ